MCPVYFVTHAPGLHLVEQALSPKYPVCTPHRSPRRWTTGRAAVRVVEMPTATPTAKPQFPRVLWFIGCFIAAVFIAAVRTWRLGGDIQGAVP
jgi:hypothetical protein